MRWTNPSTTAAITAAVAEAIKSVGVEAFRRTSMFSTNARKVTVKKAA